MSPLRNQVLAAAGGGPAARDVTEYAAREAAARDTVLELVHVVPADLPLEGRPLLRKGSLQSVGEATLERAVAVAAETAPEVPVVASLVSGPRAESLLTRAEKAALVVVGAPGPAFARGLWPGSLVTRLALATPCPVSVVPPGTRREPVVRQLVVGLKWPPHDDEGLLEEAFAAAERWDCSLEVLHARRGGSVVGDLLAPTRPDPERVPGLTPLIEERLFELRRAHPRLLVRVAVVSSTPGEALAGAARAGAIVLVGRGSGWVHGRLLGATTRALLGDALCPVEVVPATSERHAGPRGESALASLGPRG